MKKELSVNDQYKLAILKINDFSASDEELDALRQLIVEYNSNPNVNDKNKVKNEYLSFNRLYLASDNGKTGERTLNLNIGTAYNCYECLNGFCNVQKQLRNQEFAKLSKQRCYALSDSNRIIRNLTYDLINYIVFNSLPLDELIRQVKLELDANDYDYLRFNERGSFYGIDSFWKCDAIAESVEIVAYSYTSNRDLFFNVQDKCSMTLNLSLGLEDVEDVEIQDFKQTIVVMDDYDTVRQVFEDERFVLCSADCSNCSNCKDRSKHQITVFILHGNGHNWEITDFLSSDEAKAMRREARLQNMAFLLASEKPIC